MRIAIVTGGPVFDEAADIVRGSDRIICADSGADFCVRHGIVPDEVLGDMDSISAETFEMMRSRRIPFKTYPSHKDETDTEIALESCPEGSEITLVCSLTGRIDHELSNLSLLIKYKEAGFDITATDGRSDVIPMSGVDTLNVEGIDGKVAISIIPFGCSRIEGVTTKGLAYPLQDASIDALGSLSVSNELSDGESGFEISIRSGRTLVTISRDV
ncbi:MAG: thiamine diphosphokinase [Saccharofermentans sp.]|nr:thiamine diphosphokinase [Saccharofermentans sp.]